MPVAQTPSCPAECFQHSFMIFISLIGSISYSLPTWLCFHLSFHKRLKCLCMVIMVYQPLYALPRIRLRKYICISYLNFDISKRLDLSSYHPSVSVLHVFMLLGAVIDHWHLEPIGTVSSSAGAARSPRSPTKKARSPSPSVEAALTMM